MKKKFLSAMTAIAATTASFVCFACDGSPESGVPDDVPPTPPTAVEALRAGAEKLYSADGYKAELGVELKSANNAGGTKYSYSLEKAGDRARISVGEVQYTVDLGTGYAYMPKDDVTTFMQVLPVGAYDYIVGLLDGADDTEMPEFMNIAYDTDGNVTVSADVKNDVNKYTEPFRMSYTGTLVSLINEFLLGNDTTLSELLDIMETTIAQNKDMSASFIILTIDTQLKLIVPDLTVKKIFKSFGITDEQYAAVNNRTAGEFAEGVLSLQSKVSELLPSGGDLENIDAEQIAQTVFDALFVDEVDVSNVEEDIVGMKDDIISLLSGFKIADIVDDLCVKLGSDDLKQVIANNVKFTALGFNAKVSFDSGCISSVELTANAKHDFTGASGGILSDNDYSLECTLAVSDYTQSAAKLEIPNDLAAAGDAQIYAIAHDSVAEVYIETGSSEERLTVNSLTANGEPCEITSVSYNADTHTITFPQELINSVEAETASEIVLEVALGESLIKVTVYVLPDISWKELSGIMGNIHNER